MVSGAPWVLKKFQIDYTGESGAYLYIEARQPGLMAFILNLMGLDPNASTKVTRGAISMRQSSMRGMDQVSTALASVGAFIGGYSKPIGYLVAAAIFVIAGIGMTVTSYSLADGYGESGSSAMLWVGLFMALVMVVLYAIKKQLYIGFETSGGAEHYIVFKRSVIEGVSIDIDRIEEALMLVNGLISSAALGGAAVVETASVQTVGRQDTITAAAPAAPVAPVAPASPASPAPAAPLGPDLAANPAVEHQHQQDQQ